jgi:hypothetical protein
MTRQAATALVAAAAMVAFLVPVAQAGSGPTAQAAGEELVDYDTGGRLKPRKRLEYRVVCGAPLGQFCQMEARSKLKLRGPDLGPIHATGVFLGGQTVEVFLKLNRAAQRALKRSGKAARLVTKVTATNTSTGEVDVDKKSFRFKR